jgi:hypothetical protein
MDDTNQNIVSNGVFIQQPIPMNANAADIEHHRDKTDEDSQQQKVVTIYTALVAETKPRKDLYSVACQVVGTTFARVACEVEDHENCVVRAMNGPGP